MPSQPYSRRRFLTSTALSLPLLAGCHRLGARTRTGDFVRVKNGQFVLRGKPYRFVGANMWFGCYLGDAALRGGRTRLVRELDQLQQIGVTNIRLLAGSETSQLAGAIARGITRNPGDYDEELLRGLDFCLDEMARRDMKAILFLSNFWQWSGGFAQYVNWATGAAIPDPTNPASLREIGARSCGCRRSSTQHQERMSYTAATLRG